MTSARSGPTLALAEHAQVARFSCIVCVCARRIRHMHSAWHDILAFLFYTPVVFVAVGCIK